MKRYFMPVEGERIYLSNKHELDIQVSREFRTTPDSGIDVTKSLPFHVELSVRLDQYGKQEVFIDKLWVDIDTRNAMHEFNNTVYFVAIGEYRRMAVIAGKRVSDRDACKFVVARDWPEDEKRRDYGSDE